MERMDCLCLGGHYASHSRRHGAVLHGQGRHRAERTADILDACPLPPR